MSASNQTAGPSTDNFTAIFHVASTEYHRVTGKRLDTHPSAAQLDTCDSPEAVSTILRAQAQAFSEFHKGSERLMALLDPIVHSLFTFSATLGEGIGLVSHFDLHLERLFSNLWFVAILASQINLHRHQPSPRGMYILISPVAYLGDAQLRQ
jgi:hypothetical protein